MLLHCFFVRHSGLRGAVAISLSLALDSQVREAGDTSSADVSFYKTQTEQLFAMVGGVAFLTLFINGTLSGPLLTKLGLALASKSRIALVDDFERTAKAQITDDFVRLLAEPIFQYVDFAVIREHVPELKDLTLEDLKSSVMRNKDVSPYLDNIVPYLVRDDSDQDLSWAKHEPNKKTPSTNIWDAGDLAVSGKDYNSMNAIELRKFFIELLQAVYNRQIDHGVLNGRDEFVTFVLLQSLEFELENVSKGKTLQDWVTTQKLVPFRGKAQSKMITKVLGMSKFIQKRPGNADTYTMEYRMIRNQVYRALAFIQCHKSAEKHMRQAFSDASDNFQEAEQLVLSESESQVDLAQDVLKNTNKEDLYMLVSHYFCTLLLNKMARYAKKLNDIGILQEREVTGYLQKIAKQIDYAEHCGRLEHPGQLAQNTVETSDTPEQDPEKLAENPI